ncbi:CGNR zinc finger domain-containing protein [Lentzea sp. NPDC034063]|uniref:CGNR zinc finger domain-containing protein n=1 Tax=unclassified Lentzea TaxID=2643253 RepID=UPI0033C1CA2A
MTWTATERYELQPAPDTLGFVHNLLNTRSAGRPRKPDLLAELQLAQEWLDDALEAWSAHTGMRLPQVQLDETDLEPLRNFRTDIHVAVMRHADDDDTEPEQTPSNTAVVPLIHSFAVAAQLDTDGNVSLAPRGTGWRQIAALTLIAIEHGQGAGTWHRLKVCRNPRCQGAFYDRSRNNSGVWDSVKLCGNQANLRAYRARKRAGDSK